MPDCSHTNPQLTSSVARGMDESTDVPESTPIPPDALPVPVVGIDHKDAEAIITSENDAFEATFGDAVGTPATAWVDSHVAPTAADTTAAVAVLRGDRASDTTLRLTSSVEAEPTCYRLQPIAVSADRPVYTLLTPADSACTVEVDRLASVISHDLRNPLDVAAAHLQAARETGDPEHFEQLAAAHDRMERIIQDVLTLARGEDAVTSVAGIDLGAVAADAWATVDTETASLSVADDLPTLAADRDRLQRLFENLFRNSVEHGSTSTRSQSTDDTNETLTVTVGRDGNGFFVADDGAGIPVADREQVFESGYVRDDSGHTTGLGLTIVEEIAEAHEWEISLTDSDAGGARFEFHPCESSTT